MNIQDYILTDITTTKKTTKAKKTNAAEYELLFVSGCDFAIKRKKGSVESTLVAMLSQDQVYIKKKDEVTTILEVGTSINDYNKDFYRMCRNFLSEIADDFEINASWIDNAGTLKQLIEYSSTETRKSYGHSYRFGNSYRYGRNILDKKNLNFVRNFLYLSSNLYRSVMPDFDIDTNFKQFDFVKKLLLSIYNDEQVVRRKFTDTFVNSEKCDKTTGFIEMCLMRDVDWLTALNEKFGISGVKQFLTAIELSPIKLEGYRLDESLKNLIVSFSGKYSDFESFMVHEAVRQGYANAYGNFLQSYTDYLRLQEQVYGEIKEKYPKNLASEEMVLAYKQSVLQQKIDEAAFAERVAEMSEYETTITYEDVTYKFISPKTRNDLIEEGRMQSNCVGSYANRIISGESYVFFMRKSNAPTQSYITVEVCNDKIVQILRKFNRPVSEEERKAAEKWLAKILAKKEKAEKFAEETISEAV